MPAFSFDEQYRICRAATACTSSLDHIEPGAVFFALKRKIPPGGLPRLAWEIFRQLELRAPRSIPVLVRLLRNTPWADRASRIDALELDGNAYARKALELGASYVFVDNPAVARDRRCILVDDVTAQLEALAVHHRAALDLPVLAVTGSVGKTTTTGLAAAVLRRKFPNLLATQRSSNSYTAVLLNVLSARPEHEALVLEFGGVARGTIAAMCAAARPTHGILTRIGVAHLGTYGSVEGIRTGKWELVDFLSAHQGHFFKNVNDDWIREQPAAAETTTTYGSPGERTGRPQVSGSIDGADPFVRVNWADASGAARTVKTRLVGLYNLDNILAAIAVGRHFEIPPEAIDAAIEGFDPVINRSQLVTVGGVNYILDSGSVNPTSLAAALRSFDALDAPGKYILLGDMLRLGGSTAEEHRRALELVRSLSLDGAYFVGPAYWRLRDESLGRFFPNTPALRRWWRHARFSGGTVLVKSATSFRLIELLGLAEAAEEKAG